MPEANRYAGIYVTPLPNVTVREDAFAPAL